MGRRNSRIYLIEFLSVFVAVISAFALNNWNDDQRDRKAESKILIEIRNGLEKDLDDVRLNILGHQKGIKAANFWREIINDENPNTDTLIAHYFTLTRDFVSIQNTSGYEALKSKGFELIQEDSLRSRIISLYEFDYQTLEKLEEEYHEMQYFKTFFIDINKMIAPNLEFDSSGNIIDITLPLVLSESDRKIFLSYLWRLKGNRNFILTVYRQVESKIEQLMAEIDKELEEKE